MKYGEEYDATLNALARNSNNIRHATDQAI